MKALVVVALVGAARFVSGGGQGLAQLACEIEETPPGERVAECGCEFVQVNDATSRYFGPILLDVTQRKFFKYFKVQLDRECPFWDSPGMCARRECAISECPRSEVPAPWVEEDDQRAEWIRCSSHDLVDRTWLPAQGWEESGGDEVWIEQEEGAMVYVDLLKNPEKFTGYDGEAAHRIWRAIYEENCFKTEEVAPKETFLNALRKSKQADECLERRVFYKLISGLQASISTHIAKSDFDDWRQIVRSAKDKPSALLGVLLEDQDSLKNDQVFVSRVGAHKDRLHNLYFTYLFVLRAVTKAKEDLLAFDYDTGDPVDDARTRELVQALVKEEDSGNNNCTHAIRDAFDETVLFKPPDVPGMSDLERAFARESVEELRAEFVTRFRNISRIMDCVTCERCRLWGKLQVLGIGTALKIFLMDGDDAGLGVLQRNEVVAVINTLAQLAKSVDSVREWQRRDLKRAKIKIVFFLTFVLLLLALVIKLFFLLVNMCGGGGGGRRVK